MGQLNRGLEGQPARPPLEAPQMGQLNRGLEAPAGPQPGGTQNPAGAQPGGPQNPAGAQPGGPQNPVGAQPGGAQNPAGPQPGGTPAGPRAGRPPLEAPQMGQLNRGLQDQGDPAGGPALPHNPDAAVGHQAATAALGRPQRPPLEAPQMGQLNRPLTPPEADKPDGDDAPSGLPPRPQQ
jgi:hypothetical protein